MSKTLFEYWQRYNLSYINQAKVSSREVSGICVMTSRCKWQSGEGWGGEGCGWFCVEWLIKDGFPTAPISISISIKPCAAHFNTRSHVAIIIRATCPPSLLNMQPVRAPLSHIKAPNSSNPSDHIGRLFTQLQVH